MPRRSMLFFLILVFAVALGGVYLGINLFGSSGGESSGVPQLITFVVRETVVVTHEVAYVTVVTATPLGNQVVLPTGIVGTQPAGVDALNTGPGATIDPTLLQSANASVGLTASALPPNCILHSVVEGDTPFGIAEQYGANPFDLMTVNGLTEETAALLQIGEILIVPLEGCPIVPPPTATPGADTATPEADEETEEPEETTPTPSPSPTITLAPTAVNASIEIVEVANAGDITLEYVRIRNNGGTVDITGWALSDLDNNVYTFGQQFLFSNSEITINTRAGQNTPVVLFWGLDAAVWGEPGDILTLRDAQGRVMATIRMPTEVDLP